jgi:hypothetical protein
MKSGTNGSKYKNNHLPDQPESCMRLEVTASVGRRRISAEMLVRGVG